jgi:hypothetical protein
MALPPIADDLIERSFAGTQNGGNRTFGFRDRSAVLAKGVEAKIIDGFADELILGNADETEDGLIGEENFCVGVTRDDANVNVVDEGAEALFAIANQFFSGLAIRDIADDDQRTLAAVESDQRAGKLSGAVLPGFCTENKFQIVDFAVLPEVLKELLAGGRRDPEAEVDRIFVENFLAGIASELRITVVDFEIISLGKRADGEAVWTIAEGGEKYLLGAVQGPFGGEEIIGDAALAAIGEDEPDRGRASRWEITVSRGSGPRAWEKPEMGRGRALSKMRRGK